MLQHSGLCNNNIIIVILLSIILVTNGLCFLERSKQTLYCFTMHFLKEYGI